MPKDKPKKPMPLSFKKLLDRRIKQIDRASGWEDPPKKKKASKKK